ncbi:MAG: dihydrodipicolinate synthase family protein [Chloroflexi bacterium]|nr:dihydrodipicolinate synthase family protein [Chloroflexota bacterium]
MTAPDRQTQAEVLPHGVIAPVVSPIADDGSVDTSVLRAMLRRLLLDVDGVFVLGTSGEMPALPEETALEVARVAIDEVGGAVPVYLGVGDVGLERTLARIERFGSLGADILVVTTPYYFAVPDAGLTRHFTEVADAAPVPIMLYNVPQSTHNSLGLSVIRTLAEHPRIVGIKDSSGDPFLFAELLRIRGERFRVLQGREQLLGPSIWAGADGSVTSLSNIAPRLVRALSEAAADPGQRARAHQLQDETTDLARLFDQGYWLCALHVAMGELGWAVGGPRPPLVPLDEAQRAAVRAIVAKADPGWLASRDDRS